MGWLGQQLADQPKVFKYIYVIPLPQYLTPKMTLLHMYEMIQMYLVIVRKRKKHLFYAYLYVNQMLPENNRPIVFSMESVKVTNISQINISNKYSTNVKMHQKIFLNIPLSFQGLADIYKHFCSWFHRTIAKIDFNKRQANWRSSFSNN